MQEVADLEIERVTRVHMTSSKDGVDTGGSKSRPKRTINDELQAQGSTQNQAAIGCLYR